MVLLLYCTSQESQRENKIHDLGFQRKSLSASIVVVVVKMQKELIPKPRNLISDLSEVFYNGVFRVRMGSFLRRAQNSEAKIGVPEVSWMLVAVSGPYWE